MKKAYYYLTFEQVSPLRISNGQHEESDSDLMLDGRGLPFIPGSSLAGIFRHKAVAMGISADNENRLFGIVLPPKEKNGENVIEKSAIIFNDAVLDKNTLREGIAFNRRDGVGLGEWGTAKKTSKFDFQIAETSCKFHSIIEWAGNDEQYSDEIEKFIEPVIKNYVAEGIRVGARTSRGYGQFKLGVKKRIFVFPESLDRWIDFNPYDEKAFEDAETLTGEKNTISSIIDVSFKMISPFSVKVNTAKTELAEDGSVPDSVPMENYKGNPVIPGTAWAGAFRHHMHDLLRDTGVLEESDDMRELDELFGMPGKLGGMKKSKIIFSETEISVSEKSVQKGAVMRTAIDRFTAAPRTSALFTNMVYNGGQGKLRIEFKHSDIEEKYLELLAACICDLHLGLISLGGEGAVGRGIMQVEKVVSNGIEKTKLMIDSINNGSPLNWLKEDDKNA